MRLLALPFLLALVAAACASAPRFVAEQAVLIYPDVVFFGSVERRAVALTLDDGPDPTTTPVLLDTLDRVNAKATFFLIGERAAAHPQIAQEIAGRGHEIGHHLWQERTTARLGRADLERAVAETSAVLDPVGDVRWLRPGGGWVNDEIVEVAGAAGMRVVVGDILPIDTHVTRPELVAHFVLEAVRPGSIVTIHDHGDRGLRAATIIEILVPALRERGYAVETLSGLLGA